MNPGLVSTIIPVYNRSKMLSTAVRSVVEQSYSHIEIIIVDDGSTDDTAETAESLAREYHNVKVLWISNSGPGAAREAGRQIAEGEFIQYLDSDDILMKTKFERQVKGLKMYPDAVASYGKTSIELVNENRIVEEWKRTGEEIVSLIPSMLSGRWWGTSTPLYRRSVCDAVGAWSTWVNEEDWEYDCRVGFLGGSLHYVPETLSLERQHNEDRLSYDGATDPKKLRSRSLAHQSIVKRALDAKIDLQQPDFLHLLRATFLLSRQCGAAGLIDESRNLFSLARENLDKAGFNKRQTSIYALGARLIGWNRMGKLSAMMDQLHK